MSTSNCIYMTTETKQTTMARFDNSATCSVHSEKNKVPCACHIGLHGLAYTKVEFAVKPLQQD
jgi:hypothetical protein